MQHDPEKYLFDMLSSCHFLLEFTEERTLGELQNDRAFRSAVERELQIIGEALMQLARVDLSIAKQISEYQRIIGFRHVLVHGYDILDQDLVWTVVREKLPVLRDEVQALLNQKGEQL